ncbi:hypothetical protein [Microbacterium sp.]|uniref:hypothetical protein n=1 Tax=Microbacterium sp. TaxID=51671 RepID=UPI00333F5EDC
MGTDDLTGIPALLRRVDRIAAGRRQRDLRAPRDLVAAPKVRGGFRAIRWILTAEILVGLAALVIALVNLLSGRPDSVAVWLRGVVVLGLTLGLGYFALRAGEGWYWAYQRLRLFSRIFPTVTLVIAAIPGLYPFWMVIEQIVFSLLMIGVGDIATSDAMRTAFAKAALRRAEPYER